MQQALSYHLQTETIDHSLNLWAERYSQSDDPFQAWAAFEQAYQQQNQLAANHH